jgi:hypothetical protein
MVFFTVTSPAYRRSFIRFECKKPEIFTEYDGKSSQKVSILKIYL